MRDRIAALWRRVHAWNESEDLDAIAIMADVEETLFHLLSAEDRLTILTTNDLPPAQTTKGGLIKA